MSPAVMSYVLDPLERAAKTFLQQFTVILLALPTAGLLLQQNWLTAADSAGFAAAISIGTSILTFPVPKLPVAADLFLRVLKTGLQSFLGTLAAGAVLNLTGADWKGALGIAVPVAMTALLTGLASWAIPVTDGASLVPAGQTPALPGDDVVGYDPNDEDDESASFPAYDPEVEVEPLTEAEGLPMAHPDGAGEPAPQA